MGCLDSINDSQLLDEYSDACLVCTSFVVISAIVCVFTEVLDRVLVVTRVLATLAYERGKRILLFCEF